MLQHYAPSSDALTCALLRHLPSAAHAAPDAVSVELGRLRQVRSVAVVARALPPGIWTRWKQRKHINITSK